MRFPTDYLAPPLDVIRDSNSGSFSLSASPRRSHSFGGNLKVDRFFEICAVVLTLTAVTAAEMSFTSSGNDPQDVYHYSYGTPQSIYGHYITDSSNIGPSEESNFWSSSPRSDSPSPSGPIESPVVGPYQIYTPITYSQNDCHSQFKSGYNIMSVQSENGLERHPTPFIRVVKRRNTANKKERRRTQSINMAYADLRDCIPNVPADTKLSKIKTLRLATSYISYLTEVLETDDPAGGFRAELATSSRKSSNSNSVQVNECSSGQVSPKSDTSEDIVSTRRVKGRTGWPQHVWALELKQEQAL